MVDNYELYHYGVRGMKWGVRRSRQKGSGKSTSAKTHSDALTGLRNKKVSQMSDSELRRVVNRMQLETQYKSLSGTRKKSRLSRARNWLQNSKTGKTYARAAKNAAYASLRNWMMTAAAGTAAAGAAYYTRGEFRIPTSRRITGGSSRPQIGR